MTMGPVWKTKEVILDSVFSANPPNENFALSALGHRTALPPISWLMQTALTRPNLISLAAGFTDNATLPVEISRKLLNDILSSPKTGRPALQYGITAGEINLRTVHRQPPAKTRPRRP